MLYCSQHGRVRRDNVRNLGAENYFYKLHPISEDELAFLGLFINDSPEGLRPHHERIVSLLAAPHEIKRQIELGHLDGADLEEIERAIVELNETLHTQTEETFRTYLRAMRSGDLSYLDDAREASAFYHSLSVQYARTNHLKLARIIMPPERMELYRKVANPLIHIISANVGLSLYSDRKRHRVILIDNNTPTPFITADQPIINIATDPTDTEPPERFELYYPISPTKAMLLVDSTSENVPDIVSLIYVQQMNLRMAAHSYRQLYASEREVLESISKELPAYLSCFSRT
jgi:hypothetical protein